MPAKASEIKLISRIADGEEAAFSQLYTSSSHVIYRYVMRITGDRDQADNLLVKTYQQAWLVSEDYNHQLPPENWLVKIAREQALNSEAGKTENVAASSDTLNLAALDRQKAFVNAMVSLSLEARDSLALVLVHGYTYHAISEIMGVSIDVVKSRVFEAKNQLKDKLKKFGIKKSEVSRSNILRELIPLYINGALAGKHKIAFEKSLKNDPNLKQEYMEFYEIESYFDHLDTASRQHLDRLYITIKNSLQDLEEIDTQEPDAEKLPHIKIDFLHHVLSSPQIGWGLAILQFAVLLGVLIFVVPQDSDSVQANISAVQLIQQQTRGKQLNVIFQDTATHKQIRDLLLKHKAGMVSGPTNIGLYTIAIDGDEQKAADVLNQLRTDEIVLLADPAY